LGIVELGEVVIDTLGPVGVVEGGWGMPVQVLVAVGT